MKVKDKEALFDWDAYRDNLVKSTPVPVETIADKKKRIAYLLSNQKEFYKYYFPNYCKGEFAKFHLRLFRDIEKPGKKFITRKWARDLAKSVICDIFIPIFRKQTDKLKVLLLVSRTHQNATDLLTPLRIQLEFNQRIISDFGKQKGRRWEEDSFVTKDRCWFVSVGMGENPRGKRNEEYRPTDIVVDDADDDEVCRNPRRLNEDDEWLQGALFPTFDISGNDNIWLQVNNGIAEDTLIDRASKRADSHETICLLDKNNESVWPEYLTTEQCLYMITHMDYRMSQREYFHKSSKRGTVFKPDWIHWDKVPPLHKYQKLVFYIDPAYKGKSSNCFKAAKLWGKIGIKYYHLKAFMKQCSIPVMVKWLYDFQSQIPENVAIQYYMEEVFLQDMFFDDFIKEGKERGWMLHIKGDKRKKPDKFERIEASASLWERGCIIYNIAEENDPDMKIGLSQTLDFEKGCKGFIDGPDADEGALALININPGSKGSDFYNTPRSSALKKNKW